MELSAVALIINSDPSKLHFVDFWGIVQNDVSVSPLKATNHQARSPRDFSVMAPPSGSMNYYSV